MPPGRPSKPTRLPVDLIERLTADALAAGVSLPELVEARCYPQAVAGPGPMPSDLPAVVKDTGPRPAVAVGPARCTCTKPTMTGYGVCTTCHLRRR